jgi:GTP-binding protein EngB required for normal cell division
MNELPTSKPGAEAGIALAAALEAAEGWCDETGRSQLQRLRQRLQSGMPRVLLVGEAKRGKSTLGNALLGRHLLPTGVLPVTAITTAVTQGTPEQLTVRYLDGRVHTHSIEALADFVTEKANPSNEQGVQTVTVKLDHVFDSEAVLVDTPGVGSVLVHNTDQARDAMAAMDLAVFVLTSDPPISRTELELLTSVRESAVATYVVLNKTDRLEPAELAEARDFVARVTGTDQVFPCSARTALAARLEGDDESFADSGIAPLLQTLQSRLTEHGTQDLHGSLSHAARHVLSGCIDRWGVTEAALLALSTARRDDVDLFARELDGEARGTERAQALVAWEATQALTHLDDDAAATTTELTKTALSGLDTLIAGDEGSSPERLGEIAHQLLARTVGAGVTAWRNRRITALQQTLRTLVDTLQTDLDRVADDIEASAERLLGMSLRPVVEPVEVPDLTGFRLDFSPDVGWNTAAVQQVRRHLPVRARRRAVIRDLQAQARDQTAKHMGRARSDLQSRLEVATRQLQGEVQARLHEQRNGLQQALAAAHTLEEDTHTDHFEQRRVLAHRIRALDAIRNEVDSMSRQRW